MKEQIEELKERLNLWAEYLIHETFRPLEDMKNLLFLIQAEKYIHNTSDSLKLKWIEAAKLELGS
jgi:hypothetical protein